MIQSYDSMIHSMIQWFNLMIQWFNLWFDDSLYDSMIQSYDSMIQSYDSMIQSYDPMIHSMIQWFNLMIQWFTEEQRLHRLGASSLGSEQCVNFSNSDKLCWAASAFKGAHGSYSSPTSLLISSTLSESDLTQNQFPLRCQCYTNSQHHSLM
jgi:hypothetical protein